MHDVIGKAMTTLGRRGLSLLALPVCVCVLLASPAGAADPFTVRFASVSEGQTVLTTVDDFVSRLSPFDRASRLKTDQPGDASTVS